MKYGQIAGNASINTAIYRCFAYLSERDAQSFVRRFRDQKDNNSQVMHTFRELILGGYLGQSGYHPTCTLTFGTQTPDWALWANSDEVSAIVELVNFHPAKSVEDSIMEHRDAGQVWVGRVGPHGDRLQDRLEEKAAVYKSLVTTLNVPYVVAVFSEFIAALEMEDVLPHLLEPVTGLFDS